MDTTFDHLIIEQDKEVTGDPHTDGVSNIPSATPAFDTSDAFSVCSTESIPVLIPAPEDNLDAVMEQPDENSDSWTQAPASTMAETDPYGFELEALPDYSAPDDAATINVTALPHGAAIDTSPVRVTIDVPAPPEGEWHTVTRTGRHVRRPGRFRHADTTAIFAEPSYYSVFDLTDDTFDYDTSTDGNSLYEFVRPYGLLLRREPYGLANSPVSHAVYMRSIDATLANLSQSSSPPIPESTLVGLVTSRPGRRLLKKNIKGLTS